MVRTLEQVLKVWSS